MKSVDVGGMKKKGSLLSGVAENREACLCT